MNNVYPQTNHTQTSTSPQPSRLPTRTPAESSKAGRAIVLTTHSMEEADILGDSIGIMARGKLRALGSAIRLKQARRAGQRVPVLGSFCGWA
jgi:ABC-type uncharacterized transport system ATPase subunit